MVTAGVVAADSTSPTDVGRIKALVAVNALLSLLDKSVRTLAFEGADGVDAQVLAVVLLGHTLIQIDAGAVIAIELVSGGTHALVTSHGVAAVEAAGRWGAHALVHVQAHLLARAGLVSVIAGATEASERVDAGSVCTESGKHAAVVHVLAVRSKSGSVRAELHESSSSGVGALLTVITPALTAVTTALSLGEWKTGG